MFENNLERFFHICDLQQKFTSCCNPGCHNFPSLHSYAHAVYIRALSRAASAHRLSTSGLVQISMLSTYLKCFSVDFCISRRFCISNIVPAAHRSTHGCNLRVCDESNSFIVARQFISIFPCLLSGADPGFRFWEGCLPFSCLFRTPEQVPMLKRGCQFTD